MADEEKVIDVAGDESSVEQTSSFWSELLTSPLNLALLGLCCFLLYQIVKSRRREAAPNIAELPPLKKQDFTLEQLRKYDGRGEGGRILMAVNGRVFDVTKGRKNYGPGGPYGVFAGRDASRGLGTFSVKEDAIKNHYDDLSDLTSKQMESIREWELQFMEKYQLVGRLLKDGEEPTDYTDTEEEMPTSDKSKAE